MVPMENQLHAAGKRPGRLHHKSTGRRAGLPAKRFFTRFARMADVPAGDLEFLSQSLDASFDVDTASNIPALRALVHRELRSRGEPGGQ